MSGIGFSYLKGMQYHPLTAHTSQSPALSCGEHVPNAKVNDSRARHSVYLWWTITPRGPGHYGRYRVIWSGSIRHVFVYNERDIVVRCIERKRYCKERPVWVAHWKQLCTEGKDNNYTIKIVIWTCLVSPHKHNIIILTVKCMKQHWLLAKMAF